jgi:hypothetical protein
MRGSGLTGIAWCSSVNMNKLGRVFQPRRGPSDTSRRSRRDCLGRVREGPSCEGIKCACDHHVVYAGILPLTSIKLTVSAARSITELQADDRMLRAGSSAALPCCQRLRLSAGNASLEGIRLQDLRRSSSSLGTRRNRATEANSAERLASNATCRPGGRTGKAFAMPISQKMSTGRPSPARDGSRDRPSQHSPRTRRVHSTHDPPRHSQVGRQPPRILSRNQVRFHIRTILASIPQSRIGLGG